ncbi:MAG: peptidyl-prolyl cis-trans isomerase [Candidatus Thiodiazotropha endolucinida]|nr:peptidyl-prolyl cis-trans isomerase [Candidatus Thiodiazotropha taylori]MCG8094010.1 peptidyl-prolyl cis-trans isomerase [Candidatus Thiodiazotropha endolucinida]MCG8061678.1 peptidyl-prolyl cis-trans isomerase [Candidatus Thiodiazotropha taylori]MCG8066127.1 peptidyl-prolyl cis-trans isomerase [Candidatus Thiodiazotropha taylori]MCW4332224.1 peptidyl-prolyl cis-trans isomerase [Candidatus Thiodiazotropha endolucinida]
MRNLVTLAAGCFLTASAWGEPTAEPVLSDGNILARVDDRIITFPQLNTQLNSTAVVGLSTPALGTPERRTVILTLLDKAISVNLLYLDAVGKGKLEDPNFKRELQEYADGMLAGLYRRHYLKADSAVSEADIAEYVKKHFAKDTELDDKMRPLVEAKVKKEKYLVRKQGLRKHLHAGTKVMIHTRHLEIEDDGIRSDEQVIAEYDGNLMTWGESKKYLTTLNNSIDINRRLKTLNGLIDNYLLAKKGREAGLDRDPGFQSALAEFSVTRLVNQHRSALAQAMQPTEQEVRDYFTEHQGRITFNEHRKLQMVVLKDEKTALDIMEKLGKGELTIYQAALNHSIDPRAKQTLGDFGWVEEGSGFPALDELAFTLEIGELGGPVETPAGWHIIRVTDRRVSKYTDINDPDTRQQTRRLLLKERLNDYVVELRKREYPVVVYEENLNRLLQEEAQWIAAKSREMEQHPERAKLILDEMKALVE